MSLSAFATITPKPEFFASARDAILEIVPLTRGETGCLTFELHEAEEGGQLHLYEVWAGRTAFDAHHAMDYTQSVFKKYEDWLAKPVEIAFMRPVE